MRRGLFDSTGFELLQNGVELLDSLATFLDGTHGVNYLDYMLMNVEKYGLYNIYDSINQSNTISFVGFVWSIRCLCL